MSITIESSFQDMTLEKKRGNISIVQCNKCGKTKEAVTSDHKRTCKGQSKYTNSYHCPPCLRSLSSFKQASEDKFWKSKSAADMGAWRAQCSARSTAVYDSLTDEQKLARAMISRETKSPEVRAKTSTSIKAKFNDPEYRAKTLAAVRANWTKPEYRAKMAAATAKHLAARTGLFTPQPRISKIQKQLYSILEDLHIEYKPEHRIGYYTFDCYLPQYSILIECNGDYWHHTPVHIRNDKGKTTFIERYHPELLFKTIWEHDFLSPDKVRGLIIEWTSVTPPQVTEYNLADCTIVELDNQTATEFVQKYHYTYSLGHGRSQLRYGVMYKDILLAVACYASVTRNETATRLGLDATKVRELVKLCARPDYHNKNLLSWLISNTVKLLHQSRPDIKCLVTFADTTFGHTGTVYKASNWDYDGIVPKSYWYVDETGYVMHKKTLYNHARCLKMKEAEFAAANGYMRKWGKHKLRFIKWLELGNAYHKYQSNKIAGNKTNV